MMPSTTHLVIVPSYNTGPRLRGVVAELIEHWQPVVVVIDGSTDGSDLALEALARERGAAARPPGATSLAEGSGAPVAGLNVVRLPRNSGKGAAVLAGARWALERGFTHALTMDADGQHHADHVPGFMSASRLDPQALVLGRPIFPPNIPAERLHGRKLSVLLVRCAILGGGIDDPLFGFRVYPLAPLLAVLGARRSGRRYDFDTEAAVRLCWSGTRPVNVPAPVRYFSAAEGGVSHFRYGRDNVVLAAMYVRLLSELVWRRAPEILRHRRRWRAEVSPAAAARPLAPEATP